MEGRRVEIALTRSPGGPVRCPGCGGECAIRGHSPERAWRHLDTMQFETRLKARVPRSDCPGCGVRTVEVPWAGKHGRFTLMFEVFAIAALRAASSVDAACGLLRIHWSTAAAIMRRAECKQLRREGDDRLVGTWWSWLRNGEGGPGEARPDFGALKESELKTGRAWSIKECFRWFWEPHLSREEAGECFEQWHGWAIRSRLEPIKRKAAMLKRHLPELLNWCDHHITNAVSEGINSRIQSIKSAARGFRYFENCSAPL